MTAGRSPPLASLVGRRSRPFSQDGKIRTAIKRQSIALDRQQGHIFSVLFQGLEAFDSATGAKDSGQRSGPVPEMLTISIDDAGSLVATQRDCAPTVYLDRTGKASPKGETDLPEHGLRPLTERSEGSGPEQRQLEPDRRLAAAA